MRSSGNDRSPRYFGQMTVATAARLRFMLTDSNAPIAAIATAPGRGGIGVIRVSGTGLSPVIRAVLGELAAARLQPRVALYGAFLDVDGGEIDRGLALYFPAPHSYTGEEVLELQGHGGPVVMQMLLARVRQAGAPPARCWHRSGRPRPRPGPDRACH